MHRRTRSDDLYTDDVHADDLYADASPAPRYRRHARRGCGWDTRRQAPAQQQEADDRRARRAEMERAIASLQERIATLEKLIAGDDETRLAREIAALRRSS